MFVDPDNPFASPPPKKSSVPNPFGPNSSGPPPAGVPPKKVSSPFDEDLEKGKESAKADLREEKKVPDSPFGLEEEKAPKTPASDLDQGFALPDEIPDPVVPPQPVPKPFKRSELTLDDDPFALPTPQNRADRPSEVNFPKESKGVNIQDVMPSSGSQFSEPVVPPKVVESPREELPPQAGPNEVPQLVLRAIFGVTAEMTRDEILEKARSLPGIRRIQLAGPDEAGAMALVRSGVQRMGLGDPNSVVIHTNDGVLDLIEEPGASLAVLRDGDYGAGVRETLIIVAREVARLSNS